MFVKRAINKLHVFVITSVLGKKWHLGVVFYLFVCVFSLYYFALYLTLQNKQIIPTWAM